MFVGDRVPLIWITRKLFHKSTFDLRSATMVFDSSFGSKVEIPIALKILFVLIIISQSLSKGELGKLDLMGIVVELAVTHLSTIVMDTMGAPGSTGQLDVASMRSQVLNNLALNGLLAGVSE